MKIKYFVKNLKILLILPLLLFMMNFGDCQGQLRFDDSSGESLEVDLIQTTRADITFDVPSTATYTSLNVYAQLWDTGVPSQVGTISNVTPGETVEYTVPGLVPGQLYKIFLIDPADQASSSINKDTSDPTASAIGTVYIDTEFRLAHSERWLYGWAFNEEINSNVVFAGGYSEMQQLALGAAAVAHLSSSSLISPFELAIISPDTYNSSLGQTSVLTDSWLVIGDPYWGNTQTEEKCGEVSYFATIPTADASITSAVRSYGPNPAESNCDAANIKNRLSKNMTYDPVNQILIASCSGCSYGDAPCANQSDCGACAVYDMSGGGFNYVGLIQKRGDPVNNIEHVCERVLFIDLNNNGTNDLVYQITSNVDGTDCLRLNYVADGMTGEGVEIFEETPPAGSAECAAANTQLINTDANQDGIDDLALLTFSTTAAYSYQLRIILGSSSFDPSSYTSYYFSGDELGGRPVMADFNNDGLIDFTIVNQNSWQLWLDAATADLSALPDYDIPIETGLVAVPYDVNGDGYMDLVRSVCNVVFECEMFIAF